MEGSSQMSRKLVTIRVIGKIIPIKDADSIELAFIDGWQSVVKKGEFKVGDEVLYFEIDSYLPIRNEFEFLRKSSYRKIESTNEEGFRLRTIKLRGQLSQGLLLPLKTFPEINIDNNNADLSEILGVKKWDPPLPTQISGLVKGSFPGFIPKTDVERIQNLMEYITKYKDSDFEISIKLDGTSMTVYKYDESIGVCSRNLELKEDDNNSLWKVAKKECIPALIKENKNYALQGELIGPRIQGNKENLKEIEFYIFEIFDIYKGKYLSTEERLEFCERNNLKHVPIIERNIKYFQTVDNIDDILKTAKGNSLYNSCREGIVAKKTDDGYVKFKVINNDYLLKEV